MAIDPMALQEDLESDMPPSIKDDGFGAGSTPAGAFTGLTRSIVPGSRRPGDSSVMLSRGYGSLEENQSIPLDNESEQRATRRNRLTTKRDKDLSVKASSEAGRSRAQHTPY